MKKYFFVIIILTITSIITFFGFYYKNEIELYIQSDIRLVNIFYKKEKIDLNEIKNQDLSNNPSYKNINYFGFDFYIPDYWASYLVEDKIEINFNKQEFALVNILKFETQEDTGNYLVNRNIVPGLEPSDLSFIEVNENEINLIINSVNTKQDTPKKIKVTIPNELIDLQENLFPKYRIKEGEFNLRDVKNINEMTFFIYQLNTRYLIISKNDEIVLHTYMDTKSEQYIDELLVLLSKIKNNTEQSSEN